MELRQKEILRYAGFRGHDADELTLKKIEELKAEILSIITPKHIYREFDFTKQNDDTLIIEGVEFKSKKLVSHLKNSEKIILFAATLGVQSDLILKKYIYSDSSKAVLSQAILAEAIESYCDEVCDNLALEYAKQGFYFRPRFSPGYGDLKLESQREFFSLMDITKRIGISLSKECLMTPTKSVSAFIGVTRDYECKPNSCSACENKGCEFRKEQ